VVVVVPVVVVDAFDVFDAVVEGAALPDPDDEQPPTARMVSVKLIQVRAVRVSQRMH
jgi:hypothetical protein